MLSRLLLFACLLLFSGCGKASLEGRWVGVSDKTTLSFGPHELCAEVTPEPENVVIHRWKLDGSNLTLTSLTHDWNPWKAPGQARQWSVRQRGDTLTLKNGATSREFRREAPVKVRPELVGAWSGNTRLGVFAPHGDLLIILKHPAFPKAKVPAGYIGEYYRLTLDGQRIKMDGLSPIKLRRHMIAEFEVKGEQLTFKWDKGSAVWDRVTSIPWSAYK